MMPRKLSQAQERQVAIAYLCGISEGYIRKTWDVCWQSAKEVITVHRSREWDDPLVEFYRESSRRHSYHNAAHLYLSCNGFKVDNRDLVDRVVDEPSYRAVEEELYLPAIRRAAENSWLGRFLAPTNGYERLLDDVVGTGASRTEMVLRHVFPDALLASYLGKKRFEPSDAAYVAEASLVGKLKRGEFHISPEKAVLVDEAVKALPNGRRRIIRARFGIPSGEGESLERIGDRMHYCRERVRQLEAKALASLKMPSRRHVFELLALPWVDDEISIYRARLGEPLVPVRVDELEICTQARNKLLRAGIDTVEKLTAAHASGLLCIKGFGRKCLHDVESALAGHGLSLAG